MKDLQGDFLFVELTSISGVDLGSLDNNCINMIILRINLPSKNGNITFDTEPDKGFKVKITIPK